MLLLWQEERKRDVSEFQSAKGNVKKKNTYQYLGQMKKQMQKPTRPSFILLNTYDRFRELRQASTDKVLIFGNDRGVTTKWMREHDDGFIKASIVSLEPKQE
jgi:hypothetical protein